jgi:hypothetical protein
MDDATVTEAILRIRHRVVITVTNRTRLGCRTGLSCDAEA